MQILVLNGTVSEMTEILRRFPEFRGTSTDGAGGRPLVAAESTRPSGVTYWTENAIRELVGYLWGDQRKLMRFLFENGGAASYGNVMRHLGFKKGQQLSGIRSGLTRNARRATGFENAGIVLWRRRNDTDWEGEYYIQEDAHRLLSSLGINL